MRDPPGHGLEAANRPANAGRDQRSGREAEREHDERDQCEPELDAMNRAVDRRDALCDAHRAQLGRRG